MIMRPESSRYFLLPLSLGIALSALLVGSTFVLGIQAGTSGGPGTAQAVPIILYAPVGAFPTLGPASVDLTVHAADTGLTAGDLQFLLRSGQADGSGPFEHVPFTITVTNQSGSILASYNSTQSGYWGEAEGPYADPYGGWLSGGNITIFDGYLFSVNMSAQAGSIFVGGWGIGGFGNGIIGY